MYLNFSMTVHPKTITTNHLPLFFTPISRSFVRYKYITKFSLRKTNIFMYKLNITIDRKTSSPFSLYSLWIISPKYNEHVRYSTKFQGGSDMDTKESSSSLNNTDSPFWERFWAGYLLGFSHVGPPLQTSL